MEDKKRILKMIEEGKLSAEEGLRLLDALDMNTNSKKDAKEVINIDKDFFNIDKSKSSTKMLYIRVVSSDGERVKVNIPIDFIKLFTKGNKLGGVNLESYDIDLENIITAIEDGFEGKIVEVDSKEGDKVVIEIG